MKGIKAIFGVLACASLLFSVNAIAQENNNRDENGKVIRGAYETNKAFDNTWIGVGAGINTVVPGLKNIAKTGKIGIAADLNFGKWWTPAIGMRLGYHGVYNVAKVDFTAPAVAAGDKMGFHYVHGDILWNISNSIGGYKETRFWNFVPYMSMGMLMVSKSIVPFKKGEVTNREFSAGPGLLNVLRLSNRVNLTLDLKVLVAKAEAYNETIGSDFWFFPSATAGLAFNLGKTNFDRHSTITPVVIPVPFTTEQYNALKDRVADLEKENAALKNKIAALENELAPLKSLVNGQTYLYENGTFTAVDVKTVPVTVYFDLGSAKISAREKAHIEYFVENAVKADTKLIVNGYADKATGSVKTNQNLSEKRAKAVVDLLKKAGANEANIESKGNGGTDIFNKPIYKNRVVTIEAK